LESEEAVGEEPPEFDRFPEQEPNFLKV